MDLVIRADANSHIGTGHIMRCLALAQAWKTRGGQVAFVSFCDSDALCQRIEGEGMQVVRLGGSYPDPEDLDVTFQVLSERSGAWLVLDGYNFDSEYQYRIKESRHRLLAVDDTALVDHYYADIIVNQNINAQRLHYPCEQSSRLLLGTKYVMLRSEFLAYRGLKRKISKVASKVLITLGGADPNNQTLKVLRALQYGKMEGIEARIVLGACNRRFKGVQLSTSGSKQKLRVLRDVRNMPELMAWADIAVSAAGSTSWELAFMGVPFLTTILAPNQEIIAKGLGEATAAINLGWLQAISEVALAQYLADFIHRWEVRLQVSLKARKLVDGLGAERIIACLMER
ncbi:MAG: UDP-2,4-diacetamido-2,4,6-trideoxy-beta-L-altropyranose hydrolase [Deltaproteobacteria bacterium]|jgi:UDP-2,4-diacetamido-2,4,6-trideoxy-beta-L-altropyranose hydrolase